MNKEELRQKLDRDGDGDVDWNDLEKLVDHSNRKLFALGVAFGLGVGLIAGAVFF